MPRFQTVIKRARFVYSPYTATEMQGFAQVLADSIRARIQSGQNIYDQAAAPLKPGLVGPSRLPRLQVRARTPAHPRLDLERAHPAVPQGPDRERESRGDWVSRRSSSWPAADGFADRRLQQPARGAVGRIAARPAGGARRVPGASLRDAQGSVKWQTKQSA